MKERRAVLFDTFAFQCPHFNAEADDWNGYGCDHPKQEEVNESGQGGCLCFSCPLGYEADQEDLENPVVDWDGLCSYGEINESEYLIIPIDKTASEDQKTALSKYDAYLHRYESN